MTKLVIHTPESTGSLYERIQYPAGELQMRLTANGLKAVREASEISIFTRGVPDAMGLVLLCDAVTRAAEFTPVRLVLPYLPYARADRRFCEGDCAGLAVFGNLLNGLGLDEMVTLDVHSNKATRLTPRLRNVNPLEFIGRAYQNAWNVSHRPTVLLPDEGSRDRYNLPAYWTVKHCSKVRDAKTGALSGFEVPNSLGQTVLLVDDICDGGGTFIGIAKAIKERYANAEVEMPDLYLYITHGIFSKGLTMLLDYFEKIYTTDSFYPASRRAAWGAPNRLEVFECEPLLLGADK